MRLFATKTGHGPAIILLHGLFGMGSNLSVIARTLSETHEVHSLDLRNHGRSPWVDSMRFVDMAEDVACYMDEQELESCYLLGHSLGGKVAMQLALLAPQRVKRLIVADIAPVAYQGHHNDVFAGLHAVDLASLNSRAEAASVLNEYVHDEGIRQFLLKNLYRDEQKQFAWRMNVEALSTCYDDMRQGLVEDGSFHAPVLFIKGELSKYILPEHREVIDRLFPHAQFKIIQNTGHWLHAEKPSAFNRLILNFLGQESR